MHTEPLILEQSENLQGEPMMTISTSRGEEFIVNGDKCALGFVQLISDLDNEIAHGWTLSPEWFRVELQKLRRNCIMETTDASAG